MNLTGFQGSSAGDEECSQRLKKKGLEIPALSRYSLPSEDAVGLLLEFTALDPNTIRKSTQVVLHVSERPVNGNLSPVN